MKSIYLTKRKPGFTRDQFIIRWREHGALAMSSAFWHRRLGYVQAEPIQPVPIPGVSDEYDAIGYNYAQDSVSATWDGADGDCSPAEAAAKEMMRADELETFAGLVNPTALRVREEVLKEGGMGGVTAFLFFLDPDNARAVARHYCGADGAARVILDTVRDDIPSDGPRIHPYNAIVEVSSYDLRTLRGVIGLGEGEPWRQADLVVVARETVMWDRMS